MKCTHCGDEVKENGVGCDWRQGRCPHRYPYLTDYHLRFYNLIEYFRNFFKGKNNGN